MLCRRLQALNQPSVAMHGFVVCNIHAHDAFKPDQNHETLGPSHGIEECVISSGMTRGKANTTIGNSLP